MDNKFNVAIIGGGVIGGLISRELSRYDLNVCILEKESDVCIGSSKANTGIVHGGFDASVGTKKAKYNVLGAKMMPTVAKELGVKYKSNGTLVVGFSDEDLIELNNLYNKGIANGVEHLKIIEKNELMNLEPNISSNAVGALYCGSAGIICPYELTIASIGNAMDNGASLKLNFEVTSISYDGFFTVKSQNGQVVEADYVINCAGIYADKVANLIGDYSFKMGARKGEYILLDKTCNGMFNHTLFFCPNKMGKGIVVTNTVDGNLLLGPTAKECMDRDDKSTTVDGLEEVKRKASQMCNTLPFGQTITSFSGVRAFCDRHDFIIEPSQQNEKFINVAGIESPGLTASPAIAEEVANILSKMTTLTRKENFNAIRKPDYFFKNLSFEEKNELIKKDESYGKIVCRCEQVTLGEILEAIRQNPKATTVDGIKRRTRSGMGRCQGGFCQPSIVKILSQELGIPMEEVTKCGGKSNIVVGKTK